MRDEEDKNSMGLSEKALNDPYQAGREIQAQRQRFDKKLQAESALVSPEEATRLARLGFGVRVAPKDETPEQYRERVMSAGAEIGDVFIGPYKEIDKAKKRK